MSGSATFTMVTSSTTMNWARASTVSVAQGLRRMMGSPSRYTTYAYERRLRRHTTRRTCTTYTSSVYVRRIPTAGAGATGAYAGRTDIEEGGTMAAQKRLNRDDLIATALAVAD